MRSIWQLYGALRGSIVLALVLSMGWCSAQRLYWLGTFGGAESTAFDVSVEGRIVVGSAQDSIGNRRAFVWSRSTGLVDIGTLGGDPADAYAVSADGAWVTGTAQNAEGQYLAFRWSASRGMQPLDTLGGSRSAGYSISADGSVVVGASRTTDNRFRATFWDAQGRISDFLTFNPGVFREGSALGVSADGSRIVGYVIAFVGGSTMRSFAFYWDTEGTQELFDMWARHTFANRISPDGQVVVGTIYMYGAPLACRVVVGYSLDSTATPQRAYRWREGIGGDDLNQTYSSLLPPGFLLIRANSTSWDGRYIVGQGYNAETGQYEGFLLDTWRFGDTNGDGCIDDTDLVTVLDSFGLSCDGCYADINGDGRVDDEDLLALLFLFGSGCG